MKSIFFIAAFIIIAGAMSQPDKSGAKFSSIELTVPNSFPQNKTQQATKINLSPLAEQKSYRVEFSGLTDQLEGLNHKKVSHSFSFESCKFTQKPNFSLNCSDAEQIKALGMPHLSFLSVNPVFMLGKDESPYYLIDIVFQDKDGEDVSLKLFTTTEGLHLSDPIRPLKVTQK